MSSPVPISAMAREIPPAPVLRILSRYRREEIAAFIEVAIGLLDMADGDPDIEANGDEQDGVGAEDEECAYFAFVSEEAGCAVSDPGEFDDGL